MTDLDLTPENLHKLLGIPKPETQAQALLKTTEVIGILEQRLNRSLVVPTLTFDLKGRTAGWCRGHKIQLNVDLLNDPRYHDDMLDNTLPHEIAHSVVHEVWPKAKGHGGEWAYVMMLLGLEPERCHNYETTPARKRKKADRPHRYVCDCRVHMVTNILHKRMLQGRTYTCRSCGDRLRYEPLQSHIVDVNELLAEQDDND